MSKDKALKDRYSEIIAEHSALRDVIDWQDVAKVAEAIAAGKRVFFSAQGRSGLALRAIAIRLMHIGLTVHFAGEPSTPSMSSGDVLVAVSSSGTTGVTLSHLQTAKKVGASTVLLTAKRSDAADVVLVLPVRGTVATTQHAGSLFEQAVLMVGDAICWNIQTERGVPDSELDKRHANLQ